MTLNSIDITLICWNIMGIVLFISYLVFTYLVTHTGDFYHIRRWKAALWIASITVIIFVAFFLFSSVQENVNHSSTKNLLEFIGLVSGSFFPTLALAVPLLFVIAVGMQHRLKWWLNSDDFLDKIWKDPNKGHKSPIQEL